MSSPFSLAMPSLVDCLDEPSWAALRLAGSSVHYRPGQYIHSRGDPPGLSIVESGSVDIGVIGLDGRLVMISRLGPGQPFGDHTVFAELPRTHDVQASEDSRILQLRPAAARRVAQAHPQLRDALLRIALHRGHALLEMLDAQRRLPIAERLGQALLLMTLGQGTAASVATSQTELAASLGLSRPSISGALKILSSKGLVRTDYGRITLPDRSALSDWVRRHIDG